MCAEYENHLRSIPERLPLLPLSRKIVSDLFSSISLFLIIPSELTGVYLKRVWFEHIYRLIGNGLFNLFRESGGLSAKRGRDVDQVDFYLS
jgi:hypothetical protein